MKKLMFGLCLLIFAVTSCTQYIYVPVDKLPWIDDDKEEQEEFIPNITDNAGFAAAIADIKAGDTVELKVGAGTYTQQIMIPEGADVTIIGENPNTTVLSLPEGTINPERIEADSNDTSAVPYTGVIVSKNGSITLKNVTVACNSEDNYQVGYNNGEVRVTNLVAVNSKVHAENVVFSGSIFDVNPGMQNGFGIYLVGDGSSNEAYFKGCTVKDFNKCAVLVREGVKSFTFIDGQIIGRGATDIIAQNGIQISCADYEISGNTISDIEYTGEDSACGILLASHGAVTYEENDVTALEGANQFVDCEMNCSKL